MISIKIKKGEHVIQVKPGLTCSFSRPFDRGMIIEFKSPKEKRDQEIEKRRAIQNSTCWMICSDAAKQLGETKNDVYLRFKYEFLAPEIAKDDPDYAMIHENTQAFKIFMSDDKWKRLANKIYSGNDASVKQYAAALDQFMITLGRDGISYRDPEEYQAMLQESFYKEIIK